MGPNRRVPSHPGYWRVVSPYIMPPKGWRKNQPSLDCPKPHLAIAPSNPPAIHPKPETPCNDVKPPTDNTACSSRGWEMENLCIKLATFDVPTRAWAFPENTVPIIFEYRHPSTDPLNVPTDIFAQQIRAAVSPYIFHKNNEKEQPIYVRASSRPEDVPAVSGTPGTLVSVLVDFPVSHPVTMGMIRDVLDLLPREYGGSWIWRYSPLPSDYLMFRLKWLELNILKSAWVSEFWSSVPFEPEGMRISHEQLFWFPSMPPKV